MTEMVYWIMKDISIDWNEIYHLLNHHTSRKLNLYVIELVKLQNFLFFNTMHHHLNTNKHPDTEIVTPNTQTLQCTKNNTHKHLHRIPIIKLLVEYVVTKENPAKIYNWNSL